MSTNILRHPLQRGLDHYPTGPRRGLLLALAVIPTISTFAQFYLFPSVAPLVMKDLKISLPVYGFIFHTRRPRMQSSHESVR